MSVLKADVLYRRTREDEVTLVPHLLQRTAGTYMLRARYPCAPAHINGEAMTTHAEAQKDA
jgi:hypothetical protein